MTSFFVLLACTDPNAGKDTHAPDDSAGGDSAEDSAPDTLGCDFSDTVQLATGGNYVCARDAEGSVCCDLSYADVPLPVEYSYSTIAGSNANFCGITASTLVCSYLEEVSVVGTTFTRLEAGHTNGMCGWPSSDGFWDCQTVRGESVPTPEIAFVELAAIYDHSGCGIDPAGEIQCWGDDFPEETPPPGPFVRIAATGDVGCALRADGTMDCWGDPASSILSDAPTTGGWVDVDATVISMCAHKDDGRIFCWGPALGEWPDGPVADGISFTALDAGFWYVCGIREDGFPQCATE